MDMSEIAGLPGSQRKLHGGLSQEHGGDTEDLTELWETLNLCYRRPRSS
jgi:hypothetical protein